MTERGSGTLCLPSCHPERSGERSREPRSRMGLARKRIGRLTLFAAFGTAFTFKTRSLRLVARSTCSLGRDDRDGFCFQRSFDSLRSLRMTEGEMLRCARVEPTRPQDDRKERAAFAIPFSPLPSFVPNDTFPLGGRQEKIFSKPQNNAHPRGARFSLLLRRPQLWLLVCLCGGRSFGFPFALRRPQLWLSFACAAAAALAFRLPCGGCSFGFPFALRRPQLLISLPCGGRNF